MPDTVQRVAGETIRFPFKPYKTQLILINQALHAIQKKQNALLESPTGTGKTIAILSAVLAWKERNLDLNTPIIYASRTHSQLTQLVAELKRSPHKEKFSAVCLASRKHYCVHPHISKSDYISQECNVKKNQGSCTHFNHTDKHVKLAKQQKVIADIEDLVQLSKSPNACPYYTAFGMAGIEDRSTIVFCPYNYVLHPGSWAVNLPFVNS